MDNNLIFGIRPVVEAIEAGREIEKLYIRKGAEGDRKSTRLNSSHIEESRMPSSA